MTRQTPGPDTRGLGMRVVPPNRGRAVEGAGLESECDAETLTGIRFNRQLG